MEESEVAFAVQTEFGPPTLRFLPPGMQGFEDV